MTDPSSVRPVVGAYLLGVIAYIGSVRDEDPTQTLTQVLARQDVRDMAAGARAESLDYVLMVLLENWAEDGGPTVLNHLLADVERAYGAEREFLRTLAAPQGEAEAHARRVALRNALTVQYGARYSAQAAALAAAERDDPGQLKRWVAHPENPACCFWCRRLHGITLPLKADFGPHLGGPAVLSVSGRTTKPPKAYHGKLLCPPLHPYCECRLAITGPGSDSAGQDVEDMPSLLPFLSSASIRDMPAAKYRVLVEFLKAAAHELGMVLRRLQRS